MRKNELVVVSEGKLSVGRVKKREIVQKEWGDSHLIPTIFTRLQVAIQVQQPFRIYLNQHKSFEFLIKLTLIPYR